MVNDLSRLIKLFFRIYWFHASAWIVLQISIISGYRKAAIVESIKPPFPNESSQIILFPLALLIAFSFMVLILFLGNVFSSGQRGNWVKRLPFRPMTFNLFPLFILLGYGLCLLFLIPWGAFDSGVSVFSIGIPVAVFLALKNSKSYLTGILKSAAVGIGLIALWLYCFFDWSVHQTQLTVEVTALALFSLLWMFLGKKERMHTLALSGTMFIVLAASAIYFETRVPRNFAEATLDHDFNPTKKTWNWFKTMALTSEYWEHVEQYKLPRYVLNKSQDFVDHFSDAEKIRFIKNIENNRIKWDGIRLPKYRRGHFSSFWQPELRFRNYSSYPIGRNNVTKGVEDFLFENWVNSSLFCQLLPFEKKARYLEKLFLVEECSNQLFDDAYWSFYSFEEYGLYESQFDKYLLYAFEKSPPKTRSILMSYLLRAWGLDELSKKYYNQRFTFSQKPLTKELLDQLKQDRHRKSLHKLKMLSELSRKDFVKNAQQVSFLDWDKENEEVPLLFLCTYLNVDCNTYLNTKKAMRLSFPKAWYYRFQNLDFDQRKLWMLWIKEQIAKPENWPKIKKLLDYTKNREDL